MEGMDSEGEKPIETPYKVVTGKSDCPVIPINGFGPYTKRIATPSNLYRHSTDKIVSEAIEIFDSLVD